MQHMKVEQESILKMEGKQLFAIEKEVVLKKKQVFFCERPKVTIGKLLRGGIVWILIKIQIKILYAS